MKQNILIVCYDYSLARNVADELATILDMRVLDEIDMFNFDFAPRNIEEMITLKGEDYVLSKLVKIILSESEFENVILVSNLKSINLCRDNFKEIKNHNLVIYLMLDENELASVEQANYVFSLSNEEILNSTEIISQSFADILVNVKDFSKLDLVNGIMTKIEKYYNIG